MGRAERRQEQRLNRHAQAFVPRRERATADPVAEVGTVPFAAGRRRFAAVFTLLMGLVIVLSGTLGNLPVSTPTPLDDDLVAALQAAGQEGRPLDAKEIDLYASLPEDLPKFAATASGLGERTPSGTYRAAVREAGSGAWRPAIGYRFSGEPVNLEGQVWSSVIVWVGVDPLQTLFATGFELFVPPSPGPATPTPSAAPSASPSAAPSVTPSPSSAP